jgi:hypothetical protein
MFTKDRIAESTICAIDVPNESCALKLAKRTQAREFPNEANREALTGTDGTNHTRGSFPNGHKNKDENEPNDVEWHNSETKPCGM